MRSREHTATSAGARGDGRRQHPLQHTVAQNKAVEKRGARVQANEGEERFGAEFMSLLEQAAD